MAILKRTQNIFPGGFSKPFAHDDHDDSWALKINHVFDAIPRRGMGLLQITPDIVSPEVFQWGLGAFVAAGERGGSGRRSGHKAAGET